MSSSTTGRCVNPHVQGSAAASIIVVQIIILTGSISLTVLVRLPISWLLMMSSSCYYSVLHDAPITVWN